MSARLQKLLLASLGVVALARAQDAIMPVDPTYTAIHSQPTEGTLISDTVEMPTATVSQPSFSDTEIIGTDIIGTVPTRTGDDDGTTALTTTSTTDAASVTSDGVTTTFSASLPVITDHTTMTFTDSDGQTTTEVFNGPTASGSGSGSGSVSPTTITTSITTTEAGGEGTTSSTRTEGETAGSGSGDNPDQTTTPAAAPRVEAAIGAGFVAFVAGLLAL